MRRRRSGTLNILRTAAKNFSIDQPPGSERTRLRTDLDYRPTSLLDLFASTLREPVRGNTQRLGNLTVSEHYHIMFRLLDQAARVQDLGRDLFVGIEVLLERGETDLEPALLEDVGEAALGQATMQRHLAALKTNLARVTGTRLLSLLTAARGFSQT